MLPLTVVKPRVGSLALALLGRIRKVQDPPFAVIAGRKSFALKQIVEADLAIRKTQLCSRLMMEDEKSRPCCVYR
jgi:hypothetical protein